MEKDPFKVQDRQWMDKWVHLCVCVSVFCVDTDIKNRVQKIP